MTALATALAWTAAYVVVMCGLACVVGAFLRFGTAHDELVDDLSREHGEGLGALHGQDIYR
jgi:hypothetical protein